MGTDLSWLKDLRVSRWVLGGPWPLRRGRDGWALLQRSMAVGFPPRMQAKVSSQLLYLAKITTLKHVYNRDYFHFSSASNTSMQM